MKEKNKGFDFDFIEVKTDKKIPGSMEEYKYLNNIEAEYAVLTLMMMDERNIEKINAAGITAREFGTVKTQRIYNTIIEVYNKNKTADYALVASTLAEYKIAISEFTEVTTAFAEERNLYKYALELIDKREKRAARKMGELLATGTIDLESITKMAMHITEIEEKKNSSLNILTPAQVKVENPRDLEKVPTGFTTLDKKLLGGYCFGALNIITGYNGNGKSTMLNQMCVAEALANGYKVMMYSPELTAGQLKSWLYTTIANGSEFEEARDYWGGVYKRFKLETAEEKIDKWVEEDKKLLIYADDGIPSDSEVLLRDIKRLIKDGYRIFIIDNLMKLELPDAYKNEYIAQKIFVNKLKQLCRENNIIIHLVAHPRKPAQNGAERVSKYDVSGSGDITNLADYVTAITRITEKEKEKNPAMKDSIIEILKNRPTGRETTVELWFDYDRRRYFENETEFDAGLNRDYGYTSSEEKKKELREVNRQEKINKLPTTADRKNKQLVMQAKNKKLIEELEELKEKENRDSDMPF